MRLAPLVITGPTASGKTAAALALAQALPVRCEIISMDSALVYRGMDIGTAKPSAQELAALPHHLVDIRDPAQTYSAAEFARDAARLVADIQARGKLALVVGGTLLYLKAWREGLHDMPGAQAELRQAIEAQARAQGWPALHAQLQAVDPQTAARLSPNDGQRIQRALEVFQATGRTISSFHATKSIANSDPLAASHTATDTAQGLGLISLEPQDRHWLHQRIGQRLALMQSQGLLAEVQALRARGDLHPDLPSMRCVGYRQAWAALAGELPLADWPERALVATRQLAKRQLTWLRSMPERQVVPCEAPDAQEQVIALAQQHLQQHALRPSGAAP